MSASAFSFCCRLIEDPRFGNFIDTRFSRNRSIILECQRAMSHHEAHYYIMIYIQFGCISFQQATYHVETCMVYIRPKTGLLNANIQVIHNFLPYLMTKTIPPHYLHKLKIHSDSIQSTFIYNSNNTFAATVKRSSSLGALLTNLLIPKNNKTQIAELAFQAHFKIDIHFTYYSFTNLNLTYLHAAPIVSMASITAPGGQYPMVRTLSVQTSEMAYYKFQKQLSNVWKHFSTHVLLQRTPDCPHISDNLAIVVMHVNESGRFYQQYEYEMDNIPIYFSSFHRGIHFNFKYNLLCGVHIDYQSLIVQAERKKIDSSNCQYQVSIVYDFKVCQVEAL